MNNTINMVIGAAQIANTVLTMDAEIKALRTQLDGKIDANKFYAVAFTTDEVARLHGVAAARVRDYAKRGLIPVHPASTDAKILIRASDALLLDFAALKKEKSTLKYFN